MFVDIHCHLLPGLDDGPADPDESLAMARLAVEDGIETIVVTPHQLGFHAANDAATIRRAAADLQRRLDEESIPLRLLPGADVRIEPDLCDRIRDGSVLTLADRGRYILLELPHELYFPIEPLLEQLGRMGVTGILTHPERNLGIVGHPELLGPLVEAGCLMQITSGSLTGSFGPVCRDLAVKMLRQGWVHFIATDAHGVRSRRPMLSRGYAEAVRIVGQEAANDLCCRLPAAAAAGEAICPGPYRPAGTKRPNAGAGGSGRSLFDWLADRFSA